MRAGLEVASRHERPAPLHWLSREVHPQMKVAMATHPIHRRALLACLAGSCAPLRRPGLASRQRTTLLPPLPPPRWANPRPRALARAFCVEGAAGAAVAEDEGDLVTCPSERLSQCPPLPRAGRRFRSSPRQLRSNKRRRQRTLHPMHASLSSRARSAHRCRRLHQCSRSHRSRTLFPVLVVYPCLLCRSCCTMLSWNEYESAFTCK